MSKIVKFLTGEIGSMKPSKTPKVFKDDKTGDSYIIAVLDDIIDHKNKQVIAGGVKFLTGLKKDLLLIKVGYEYNKA